jgi:hypothetical protein
VLLLPSLCAWLRAALVRGSGLGSNSNWDGSHLSSQLVLLVSPLVFDLDRCVGFRQNAREETMVAIFFQALTLIAAANKDFLGAHKSQRQKKS